MTVVSGLARGVDGGSTPWGSAGPRGTIEVLGCSLDVTYPPEHRKLMQQIRSDGALVSEYGPSEPPRKYHFPRRSRVISGLSAAVVIVEPTLHSGSLITAQCAAEQGREVMAVPGSVLTGRNREGHALMKDGAKVVETADDILEEIGLTGVRGGAEALCTSGARATPDFLLRHMEAGESYDLDALSAVFWLKNGE